ncbi:MAG TPA: ABC transporter ATP-binding protein [Candidatus Acidoferrales bacterium]|nr:ABC transporter ATP-binding protein [Candidatus Acidoferrales bacterium]
MIQLDNLTKQYDLPSGKAGEIVAADRVNLDVADGEIFGLIGPNGAGKTTTLKMICGLREPTAGRVTVNGVDVQRHPEEAQRHIGYLSDFFSLYDDLKVWEYLDYFAHAYKMEEGAIPGRVNEVIRLMNLEIKRDELVGGLSRGMKQRLGIGRAIIHDPPLLVLDEPAAGLDPKARVELKALLRDLHAKGKTIFITSHILADLEEICTSIAIMEKGRLLRMGRLEDVMQEGKSVRRFRIKLAAAGFALVEWLGARPGVSGSSSENAGAQFAFVGSDAELAALVRELVGTGAPVYAVEEVSETLERLYSRVSSGEVM